MSRINSLNAEQRAAVDAALDSLVDLPLRTDPIDKDAVRLAIGALYRRMRMKPPEVIFALDPVSMAHEAGRDVGARTCLHMRLLRAATCDLTAHIKPRLITELMVHINHRLGPMRVSEMELWFRRRRGELVGGPTQPGLAWQIANVHRRDALLPVAGAGRSILTTQAMINCSAPDDAQALAWIASDVFGLTEVTRPAALLRVLMLNSGFVLPRRTRCWVAARPTIVRADEERQLHAADGPAVHYGSGLSYYRWHGLPVAADLMVPTDEITPQRIADQTSMLNRRILIERLGIDRFIQMAPAELAHEDHTGKLWTKRWAGGVWSAIEVVNGTPEPDGSHRHYFLQVPAQVRTAREAVAWTYGLRAEDYDVAIRT